MWELYKVQYSVNRHTLEETVGGSHTVFKTVAQYKLIASRQTEIH